MMQVSTLHPSEEFQRVSYLRNLTAPHVESFNYACGPGLKSICTQLEPLYIELNSPNAHNWASFQILSLNISRPVVSDPDVLRPEFLPRHARESSSTYKAELLATLEIKNSSGESEIIQRKLGSIPIMVGSSRCHLNGLTPEQLVAKGEEEYELGGYFISNGVEKVVRMIIVPRKNHSVAIKRDANSNRGAVYSQYSVAMRCARADQSTHTIHLHALTSGGVNIRFVIRRQEFFLPLVFVLKALLPSHITDSQICDMIMGPNYDKDGLLQRAFAMLSDAARLEDRLMSTEVDSDDTKPRMRPNRTEYLAFLGRQFRSVLDLPVAIVSDEEAGRILLRRYLLVHLSTSPNEEWNDVKDLCKAELLCVLNRKLLALVHGEIQEDNPDSLMHQELLLPGHLYLIYLKEKLEDYLKGLRVIAERDLNLPIKQNSSGKGSVKSLVEMKYLRSLLVKNPHEISRRMEYFIATGNLQTSTGLDLMQTAGYSVVAERINFLRFISHFRCVHRGQFFTEIKTTSVRRLLPEAWGFICPVHTPDGAPCGLLNHLTSSAIVTQLPAVNLAGIIKFISTLGMVFLSSSQMLIHESSNSSQNTFHNYLPSIPPLGSHPVLMDGQLIGFVESKNAQFVAEQLRLCKLKASQSIIAKSALDSRSCVPSQTEIAYVKPRKRGLYAGIYLFSGSARLLRPVRWLKVKDVSSNSHPIEYIGTFEQMYLRIQSAKSGIEPEELEEIEERRVLGSKYALEASTHKEVGSMQFLSVIGSMTPFSDMNQSPRNMYQCQMGKQAMGTPCHAFSRRSESKSYRLLIPQVPLTRNFAMQNPAGMDLFPNGLNAVVCVISYTGYDMEDAMVINKASLQRGFAAGCVYTTVNVDLDESQNTQRSTFGGNEGVGAVGSDGLPEVGARVKDGDALYSVIEMDGASEVKTKLVLHKSSEPAVVDQVRILPSSMSGNDPRAPKGPRRVAIKLRFDRTPVIGDKFASRHGQKGTLAAMWPQEDMPYSDSGIIPDILFNPNGFPSRMTIGMMIESMCGKSSALHARFQDSTPFRFDEKEEAASYFGNQLLAAGYNFYGNEVMYSGYSGEPFEVDIFIGVVHYQRLRHMVSDKFQVRSTGPVNPLTRQPIKGRKMGGAIRFGEMERDALLAHGTSFLLQDRLQNCSDLHSMYVCESCGSILSVIAEQSRHYTSQNMKFICRICSNDENSNAQLSSPKKVLLPYVFKYLTNELAAMNIRASLLLKPC